MHKGIISALLAVAVVGGAGTYGYAEINNQHKSAEQASSKIAHKKQQQNHRNATSMSAKDQPKNKQDSDSDKSDDKSAKQSADVKSDDNSSESNTNSAQNSSTTSAQTTSDSSQTNQAATNDQNSHQATQATANSSQQAAANSQQALDPSDPTLTPSQVASLSTSDQVTNLKAAAAQNPDRFKMDSAIVKGYSNEAIKSVPAWSQYSDSQINQFRKADQ